MPLGVDTTVPLNQQSADWANFVNLWHRSPEYYIGYFGSTGHPWIAGERYSLPNNSPLQSVRWIIPFGPTGPCAREGPHPAPCVAGPNAAAKSMVDLGIPGPFARFYRQQGENADGTRLSAATARRNGSEDGMRTGRAIAEALQFIEPLTGQPELVLPDTKLVFVFLDVEPQTKLSRDYWIGWAEAISSFVINEKTSTGTLNPRQPLRPSLYCAVERFVNASQPGGAFSPEITSAFADPPETSDQVRLRSTQLQHTCYALMTGWERLPGTVNDALTKDEFDVLFAWPRFEPLDQPHAPSAPVVIWQYRINMALNAFEIDLSVTSETPYETRPITDYMLRRP